VSIDTAFLKCSEIVRRELTGTEILIVGIAYNLGYGAGLRKNKEK
jgi:hypothetical protein